MEEKNTEGQEKNKKPQKIENNKKKILALALALVLLIGGTYAWLTITLTGTKTTRIEAGTLAMEIKDESAGISITDALPMSDADGANLTPYTFKIENTGNVSSVYTIYLDTQAVDSNADEFLLDSSNIKYSLTKTIKNKTDNSVVSATTTIGPKLLSTETAPGSNAAKIDSSDNEGSNPLSAGQYIEYELRLWIDENTGNDAVKKVQGDKTLLGTYAAKLRLEASQTGIEEDEAYAGQ